MNIKVIEEEKVLLEQMFRSDCCYIYPVDGSFVRRFDNFIFFILRYGKLFFRVDEEEKPSTFERIIRCHMRLRRNIKSPITKTKRLGKGWKPGKTA